MSHLVTVDPQHPIEIWCEKTGRCFFFPSQCFRTRHFSLIQYF